MRISVSDYVLLYHTINKKWLIKVEEEKKMHTHLGIIDISSLIGLEYGMTINTTLHKKIYLIEPTIHDFIMKSERNTQIVYPKDLCYIALLSRTPYEAIVLEIGPGSAGLTTFLASIVNAAGHIFSFDINSDFMKIAKKNLVRAKM